MSSKRERIIRNIGSYILLGLLAILFLFPIYWFCLGSLKTYEQFFLFPPKFWVWPLQFENFVNAYQYPSLQFGKMMYNSVLITIISVLGAVMSSAVVAFGFSRLKWRGRDQIFVLVILTMIIPTEVLLIPLYTIYSKLQLLDTWFPMIAPFFLAKPFYTFIIRQNMMGIPKEMDESAEIDGCSIWQRLFRVILPQAKPALVSAMLLAMQDQWNNYLEPLIFINSNSKQTISVGLTFFSGMYNVEWNLVFAAAVIVALPILILFVFLQRYFIQGVVVSGVKG